MLVTWLLQMILSILCYFHILGCTIFHLLLVIAKYTQAIGALPTSFYLLLMTLVTVIYLSMDTRRKNGEP